MSVNREHYRLVVACLVRLGFGQRRLGVRAGDLGPRGESLVRHASPAADHAAQAALDLDVVAKWNGVDEEALLDVVEADADLLAGGEEKGPDVDVGLELVATQHLDCEVHELLGRVGQGESHDVGGAPQAVEVSGGLEEVKLLLLGVPVGPDALEDASAVVEGVRHQPELDVLVAAELPVEVDPGVRMDRWLFCPCLRLRFHTHFGPSVRALGAAEKHRFPRCGPFLL